MRPVEEFSRLSPDLFIWQGYDPSVKADLYSTALRLAAGFLVIDPIPLAPHLMEALAAEKVAAIVVTNGNHGRAALSFAEKLDAPIFLHPHAMTETSLPDARALSAEENPFSDLSVIEVAGAAPGEIALHHQGDGGTLVVGDALIRMEPLGFALLPAKYCSDSKAMRRSLGQLLDYRSARILFAHGAPLVRDAHQQLITLLH